MDTQIPSVVQNENLNFHVGKGAVGAKVDGLKSEQKGQKIRKALADISKARKPSLSTAAKLSSSKGKSVECGSQNPKNVLKSSDLVEEEIRRCSEWAKEGIEKTHFSGNDLLALQKDIAEERVKKKVEKVMSALRGWTQMSYDLVRPMKELGKDPEDSMKLEPDLEVLLPINVPFSTSVGEECDDPFLGEAHDVWPFPDLLFDLKLKEEYEGDIVCL